MPIRMTFKIYKFVGALETEANDVVASEETAPSSEDVAANDPIQQLGGGPDEMELQNIDSSEIAASDSSATGLSARSPK